MRSLFWLGLAVLNVACARTVRIPPADLAWMHEGHPPFPVTVEVRTPASSSVGAHVDGLLHVTQHAYVVEGPLESIVARRLEQAAQAAGYVLARGGRLILEVRRFELETRGLLAGEGTHAEVEGTLRLITPSGTVVAEVPVIDSYETEQTKPEALFESLDRGLVNAFGELEVAAAAHPAETTADWARANGFPLLPPAPR